jgi:hypothetical protein
VPVEDFQEPLPSRGTTQLPQGVENWQIRFAGSIMLDTPAPTDPKTKILALGLRNGDLESGLVWLRRGETRS